VRPLALAVLVLLASVPLSAGEHVYSHRIVFEGRLLGADGFPIPARPVEFFSEGQTFARACNDDSTRAITDEWGDFRFCFHAHDLTPSTRIGVRAGNASILKPVDTAFRRTIVELRDETTLGTQPAGWNETFRITGKVWQLGSTDLEGVDVYGLALPDVRVNLSLDTPEGTQTYDLTTDAFGDFDATLRLLPNVSAENVTVRAEAMGIESVEPLGARFHLNSIGLRVPPPRGFQAAVDTSFPGAETTTQAAPGTKAPEVSPVMLVGAAIAGVLVLALKKRKKE
jgi:hypothetical protein